MALQSFADALRRSENGMRHLLLGNGFSIAWKRDVFNYGSLFKKADFSKVPHAEQLFAAANTQDFEVVIRELIASAKYISIYLPKEKITAQRMLDEAAELKNVLVRAIAENHPDLPQAVPKEAYKACRQFLSHFDRKFTLNYDLLLYWALMNDEVDELNLERDDGFRNSEINEEADYVSWEDHQSATVSFLHGALHLFDSGVELQKYTWSRTSVRLMDQIRSALDAESYPLFVSEGSSNAKLTRINHSAYLHKALRSFESVQGNLFIYGHSLDPTDDHIFRRIESGRSKIKSLFVSLYGDPETADNKRIISRAKLIATRRPAKKPLEVQFFDANSASVWEAASSS